YSSNNSLISERVSCASIIGGSSSSTSSLSSASSASSESLSSLSSLSESLSVSEAFSGSINPRTFSNALSNVDSITISSSSPTNTFLTSGRDNSFDDSI